MDTKNITISKVEEVLPSVPKKKKSNAGQPTKMTEEVLGILRNSFLMGATDKEACLAAGINPDTLYSYQLIHLKYPEQKELWKHNPKLKARITVFNNLDKPDVAKWYLERTAKDEFGVDAVIQIENTTLQIPKTEKQVAAFGRILDLAKKYGKKDSE